MEALNQKERSFAEENHGLIYAFLNYYKLPEAEYYDICAIAYLHAVKDWHSKPELREKYRFSTIAFKKMLSAKIKKYHADRVRDAYIAFSLNDLNAEGNEYLAQFPDPIYPHTIGSLVASMVEKSSSGKVRAGFNLHAIAQVLEAKSKEIKSSLTEPEKDKAAEDAFKKFLEAVLSNR